MVDKNMFETGVLMAEIIEMGLFEDTNFFFEDVNVGETKIKSNPLMKKQ